MGRGIIADVSARLVETFAANLAAMLGGAREAEPEPAPAPAPAAAEPAPSETSLPAGDLVAGVLTDRLSTPRARVIAGGVAATLLLVIGYLLGKAR
jgi:uncharacterized protein